jgi:hypothetical protein
MRKSKLYLSIAVLALSIGVYGCADPYATKNNGVKATIYENVKSISMNENWNGNK